MNLFHMFGYSCKRYITPILVDGKRPQTYIELGYPRSPAHAGSFFYAEDLWVPDPRTASLQIYAPASGVAVYLVQHNTVWGSTKEYQKYLNIITVQVTGKFREPGGEFYELAHLAANSCPFQVGQKVKAGDLLGKTGLNGWITLTDGVVDSHLHFMVGVWGENGSFKSLRIRRR
ncbi:hypothetical protein A3K34_01650 [candidate division WWE3 bacterium RIFOXYC1_FULL_40_10]|uniref:Peptidase M23 domain-containing protein n=1 Tax=candidate division WWE3 bacterium RIFOXYA2_FULL_46_9 TaxID=1802636 RepID=A0A1F4W2H4_UNCKA|nr:MAG: hypothetical protein A3K58_01650 [candidate division WWE3 bacterium RIFOXYB1_FULL_40_22]OGC61570.1 MAG: hypothetical protein A3K37_01650 [candidate division WWE3 bacterium RIFOXYA1_FULL_40_11]OGC63616.1 MAG: hypothetical protein A2264_04590 [candidate division WWE3 bacterium RIFOXYA2_FULL_46_9]OGC65953.1 MAG: hypothetical protein A3K34_01650 [candidate division WWE3 bacterium RIFOXYC1_FULL_40_10]OGC67102.1 MAG: hypothetical protein A2450_04460 [candidate division WWE3 bacterium RIFOXYC2